jgi:hypothetical protein
MAYVAHIDRRGKACAQAVTTRGGAVADSDSGKEVLKFRWHENEH